MRPLRPDDFEALFAAASDPLIWKDHFQPDRSKREVFQKFFDGAIESKGALVVIERSSGRVIGASGYRKYDGADREVEIGFTFLAREYWGGAYNGELKKHDRLTPPSGALTETVEDVRKVMASGGALLAYVDDVAVGAARYQIRSDHLYAERVGVVPDHRRRGVSAALMTALEDVARKAGLPEIRLGVRASLPSNLRHYENLGYRAFESSPHPRGPDWVIWLRKQV